MLSKCSDWSLVFGLWSLVFGLWSLVRRKCLSLLKSTGKTHQRPKSQDQRPKTEKLERNRSMTELSHIDDEGKVKMVDTSSKAITSRRAVASAFVSMSAGTVTALKTHQTPKGDPLQAARLAGIMAAKRTSDLIPLCHPLPLTHVEVEASLNESGVSLSAAVSTNAQTGVEMEALTAVSIAALTIYDMCKAIDKGITITDIRLESKTGGKSGDYTR
jgi:cyclic pyranopterin monophosphate synthase